MEIIIDVDDFSPTRHGLRHLKNLKEHYPGLKITCFTPALDQGILEKRIDKKRLKQWVEIIKECDWIEIAIHGLIHIKGEMDCSYKEARQIIESCEKTLNKIDLPFKKIWKSPYWITSNEAYKALRDAGYVVAVDMNQPLPEVEGLQMYVYNKCISKPFTGDEPDVVKYHGHIAGDFYNDISLCMDQLTTMPTDAKFLKISEYIQKYGTETKA